MLKDNKVESNFVETLVRQTPSQETPNMVHEAPNPHQVDISAQHDYIANKKKNTNTFQAIGNTNYSNTNPFDVSKSKGGGFSEKGKYEMSNRGAMPIGTATDHTVLMNSDRRNNLISQNANNLNHLNHLGQSEKSFYTNLSSRGFLQNPVIDQINVFGGKDNKQHDNQGDHYQIDLTTNLNFIPRQEHQNEFKYRNDSNWPNSGSVYEEVEPNKKRLIHQTDDSLIQKHQILPNNIKKEFNISNENSQKDRSVFDLKNLKKSSNQVHKKHKINQIQAANGKNNEENKRISDLMKKEMRQMNKLQQQLYLRQRLKSQGGLMNGGANRTRHTSTSAAFQQDLRQLKTVYPDQREQRRTNKSQFQVMMHHHQEKADESNWDSQISSGIGLVRSNQDLITNLVVQDIGPMISQNRANNLQQAISQTLYENETNITSVQEEAKGAQVPKQFVQQNLSKQKTKMKIFQKKRLSDPLDVNSNEQIQIKKRLVNLKEKRNSQPRLDVPDHARISVNKNRKILNTSQDFSRAKRSMKNRNSISYFPKNAFQQWPHNEQKIYQNSGIEVESKDIFAETDNRFRSQPETRTQTQTERPTQKSVLDPKMQTSQDFGQIQHQKFAYVDTLDEEHKKMISSDQALNAANYMQNGLNFEGVKRNVHTRLASLNNQEEQDEYQISPQPLTPKNVDILDNLQIDPTNIQKGGNLNVFGAVLETQVKSLDITDSKNSRIYNLPKDMFQQEEKTQTKLKSTNTKFYPKNLQKVNNTLKNSVQQSTSDYILKQIEQDLSTFKNYRIEIQLQNEKHETPKTAEEIETFNKMIKEQSLDQLRRLGKCMRQIPNFSFTLESIVGELSDLFAKKEKYVEILTESIQGQFEMIESRIKSQQTSVQDLLNQLKEEQALTEKVKEGERFQIESKLEQYDREGPMILDEDEKEKAFRVGYSNLLPDLEYISATLGSADYALKQLREYKERKMPENNEILYHKGKREQEDREMGIQKGIAKKVIKQYHKVPNVKDAESQTVLDELQYVKKFYESQIDALIDSRQTLERQVREFDKEIFRLERHIVGDQAKIAELKKTLEEVEKENGEYDQKYNAQNFRIRTLENDKANYHAEIRGLQKKTTEQEKTIKEQSREHKQNMNIITELTSKVEELELDEDGILKKQEEFKEEIARLDQNVLEWQKKYDGKSGEYFELEKKFDEKDRKIVAQEIKIKKLERRIENMKDDDENGATDEQQVKSRKNSPPKTRQSEHDSAPIFGDSPVSHGDLTMSAFDLNILEDDDFKNLLLAMKMANKSDQINSTFSQKLSQNLQSFKKERERGKKTDFMIAQILCESFWQSFNDRISGTQKVKATNFEKQREQRLGSPPKLNLDPSDFDEMSPLRKHTDLSPEQSYATNQHSVQIQVKKEKSRPLYLGEDAPRCHNCDAQIPPKMLEKAGEVAKKQAELLQKYEDLLHERHNSQRISRLIMNELVRRKDQNNSPSKNNYDIQSQIRGTLGFDLEVIGEGIRQTQLQNMVKLIQKEAFERQERLGLKNKVQIDEDYVQKRFDEIQQLAEEEENNFEPAIEAGTKSGAGVEYRIKLKKRTKSDKMDQAMVRSYKRLGLHASFSDQVEEGQQIGEKTPDVFQIQTEQKDVQDQGVQTEIQGFDVESILIRKLDLVLGQKIHGSMKKQQFDETLLRTSSPESIKQRSVSPNIEHRRSQFNKQKSLKFEKHLSGKATKDFKPVLNSRQKRSTSIGIKSRDSFKEKTTINQQRQSMLIVKPSFEEIGEEQSNDSPLNSENRKKSLNVSVRVAGSKIISTPFTPQGAEFKEIQTKSVNNESQSRQQKSAKNEDIYDQDFSYFNQDKK